MDIKAMIDALRKRFTGTPDEQPDAAKAGAEELSKDLPAPVMPRPAILKKRRRLQDLDEQTKEG